MTLYIKHNNPIQCEQYDNYKKTINRDYASISKFKHLNVQYLIQIISTSVLSLIQDHLLNTGDVARFHLLFSKYMDYEIKE